MFGKHSRWATALYVVGFLALGSLVAEGNRVLNLAFLIAAGTMRDIRISRLVEAASAIRKRTGVTHRPDYRQQRTFLIRMYFGAEDEKGGFTRRAYLDLSRTLHDLATVPSREDMKARATDCLRNSLLDLTKMQPSTPETLRAEFDQWHERTCRDIMRCFEGFDHFHYGQAQKWLNMTIKYRWFFSDSDPLNGWFSAAHIPVDAFVLRAAEEHEIRPTTQAPWSRWDAPEYKTFQERIRAYAKKCGVTPLEVEHCWWMKQSEP